jgi:electron transfer flavoprotein alpha subunit
MKGAGKNPPEIWVFAEQRGGVLRDVGLELLGKAREIAGRTRGRVTALLLGRDVEAMAGVLIAHGADRVMIGASPMLEPYRLLPYVSVLAGACRKFDPDVLLFGATSMGVELAPRLAARCGTGLSAHCVDLAMDDEGRLLQVVPGWGGGVLATIICPGHRPQMATIMPGVMKKPQPRERSGEILRLEVGDDLDLSGPRVLEVHREEAKHTPLEGADVVVAGGWGIGSKEGWDLVENLAAVLCAAVGATRPAVDEGWAGEEQMIGQSGKTVRPRLYIGVGISGTMHHVVGMDESDCIIAINTDRNAPIFQVADFSVIADYRELLPPLIHAIQDRLGGGEIDYCKPPEKRTPEE